METMVGRWENNSIANVSPYRITWTNRESGPPLSKKFTEAVIELEKNSSSGFVEKISVGFHFYRYENEFASSGPKPQPISNVYVPSKNISLIKPEALDEYLEGIINSSLDRLEKEANGSDVDF